MAAATSSQIPVLIVGAGPSGLLLALWLQRYGTPFRIVDKNRLSASTSRAMVVHSRCLEFYDMLGFADEFVAEGHRVQQQVLWENGHRRNGMQFKEVGKGMTKYPFVLSHPQDRHERLLTRKLEALGVTIERETEATSVKQSDESVTVVLRGKDGREETVVASYVVGCDGWNSIVRREAAIDMPGGTYAQLFYVADCAVDPETCQDVRRDDMHLCFSKSDFCIAFPLPEPNAVRFIGIVPEQFSERADRHELRFEDVEPYIIKNIVMKTTDVHWFSTYRVHHRVATTFRDRRILICGDAAHVHSPVGGQGMNTGLGDVTNLAWKLHAVLSKQSPEALLETYATERRAFAEILVSTTDRAFSLITDKGWIGAGVRSIMFVYILPMLMNISFVQQMAFPRVSQLALNYRTCSALSEQVRAVGSVCAGDRMPWLESADNFAPLREHRWQLHVFGEASQELRAWSSERELPIFEFELNEEAKSKGIAKDAIYLLRPDGHVGLVTSMSNGFVKGLDAYADKWLKA